MRKILIILLLLPFVFSCTEVTLVEPIAGGPSIEFIDVQPRTIKEFKDSIVITISYKDPDGDLGHVDPDINLMSVHDLRLKNADSYHIPLLAPSNSNITLEGTLEIKLKNTFLLGSGADEQTSYEIVMSDRAGNASNPIVTEPVTITK